MFKNCLSAVRAASRWYRGARAASGKYESTSGFLSQPCRCESPYITARKMTGPCEGATGKELKLAEYGGDCGRRPIDISHGRHRHAGVRDQGSATELISWSTMPAARPGGRGCDEFPESGCDTVMNLTLRPFFRHPCAGTQPAARPPPLRRSPPRGQQSPRITAASSPAGDLFLCGEQKIGGPDPLTPADGGKMIRDHIVGVAISPGPPFKSVHETRRRATILISTRGGCRRGASGPIKLWRCLLIYLSSRAAIYVVGATIGRSRAASSTPIPSQGEVLGFSCTYSVHKSTLSFRMRPGAGP